METTREQLAAMPYEQAIDTIIHESALDLSRQDAEEMYRFAVGGSDRVLAEDNPRGSTD